MKTFLTANTYFGKKSALRLKTRSQFNDVNEMNEHIVNLWNKTVSKSDYVFHLGYFAHEPFITNEILEVLNGEIIFFNNSTDKNLSELIEHSSKVKLYESQIFNFLKYKSVLSYYPLEIWNGNKTLHFYGDDRIKTDLNKNHRRMNVAIDNWGLKPIDIETCIELLNEFNNAKVRRTN